MISLILAVNFFICIHMFISGTSLRDKLVARMGEKTYMALFSVLSVGGLVWVISAYGNAPYVELWGQVYTWRWLASLLILLAFLFVIIGMLTKSPTAVGGESLLEKEEAAHGILRITRHPFLIGTIIWSATHLIYNGDLGSAVFFGGFMVLSIFGMKSIDNKHERNYGANWLRFEKKTSILPFMAIWQNRNTLQFKEIGVWRIVVAIIAYAVVFKLHAVLFGVAPVVHV